MVMLSTGLTVLYLNVFLNRYSNVSFHFCGTVNVCVHKSSFILLFLNLWYFTWHFYTVRHAMFVVVPPSNSGLSETQEPAR